MFLFSFSSHLHCIHAFDAVSSSNWIREVTKQSTQKIIWSHTGIFSPIMSYRNIINPLILQTNIIRVIQYSWTNPQCYKIMLGIALHENKSCNKRFYKDSDRSPSVYVSELIKTLTKPFQEKPCAALLVNLQGEWRRISLPLKVHFEDFVLQDHFCSREKTKSL